MEDQEGAGIYQHSEAEEDFHLICQHLFQEKQIGVVWVYFARREIKKEV